MKILSNMLQNTRSIENSFKRSLIIVISLLLIIGCFSPLIGGRVFAASRVANLKGTKWQLNGIPTIPTNFNYSVNFSSDGSDNNKYYVRLRSVAYGGSVQLIYEPDSTVYTYTPSTSTGRWTNTNYQYITFYGGTDISNVNLINWLYSNATLVSQITPNPKGYWSLNPTWSSVYTGSKTFHVPFQPYGTNVDYSAITIDFDNRTIAYGSVGRTYTVYSNGNWTNINNSRIAVIQPTGNDSSGLDYYNWDFVGWLQTNGYQTSSWNIGVITPSNAPVNPNTSSLPVQPDTTDSTDVSDVNRNILEWIQYFFDSAESVFSSIFGFLSNVADYGINFAQSLTSIVSWLPSDVLNILYGLFVVFIGVSIIKIIR